jgi:two-component system sensor histidine kinase KdpD
MVSDDKALSFLKLIRRAQRGKLKVYLGYGPGVGKTWQMLLEGHRIRQEGMDVVVGLVETHGRAETANLIEGLEVIPRRQIQYHGITIEEMDMDAILSRRPSVALVDELAHTNAPGGKHLKRYQDVQELLESGIHVISTLNVQHLESLYDTVESIIKVKVHERVPDSVLFDADEVVNVDLTPEDLQQRLREGKIYPLDRVMAALDHYFQHDNLDELRELTLRELASQLDIKHRITSKENQHAVPDQVMVCLSSRGPNSAMLLRYGSRLAGRLNRDWYAIYIQTPREAPTVIDAATQRLIVDTLTLANSLGAMVFTYNGDDIVDTILHFAREYRVGHIVIGRSPPLSFWESWFGKKTVVERLIQKANGETIVVVDTRADNKDKE